MTTTTASATPYEIIGGAEVVSAFVNRFYDLMDADPDYAELRALHAPDLAPMRASLAGFLSAWLGGPRDWFEQRPGACVMSAHAVVPISARTSRQWTEAMSRALADSGVDAEIAGPMTAALARMAGAMAAGRG